MSVCLGSRGDIRYPPFVTSPTITETAAAIAADIMATEGRRKLAKCDPVWVAYAADSRFCPTEAAAYSPAANVETHRTCTRCSGKGAIAAYAHVDNGRCMGCGGSGTKSSRTAAAKRVKAAEFAAWSATRAAVVAAVVALLPAR